MFLSVLCRIASRCLCSLFLSGLFLLVGANAFAQTDPAASLRDTAERLYEDGNFPLARQYYQRAFDTATRRHQYLWAANLLVDISSLDHQDGQYTRATTRCLDGLRLLERQKLFSDSTYFKLYSSLGEYYHQREYLDSSAYYFERADSLLVRHPALSAQIPEYVIYHFNNQSMLHEFLGRFSLSETLALKALLLARQQKADDDAGIICNVLAGQYERLGKYHEAMKLRLEGLSLYPRQDVQRARMYSGIGRNAWYQHRPREALRYLHLSENLYRRWQSDASFQQDSKKVVSLYNYLGQAYLTIGQLRKADAYFTRAIHLYQTKYGSRGRILAECWLAKGTLRETQGQTADALLCWNRAWMAITRQAGPAGHPATDQVLDEKKAVEILFAKGSLLARINQPEAALSTLQQALGIFRHARNHLYVLSDKLYLSETVRALHRLSLDVAYRLYASYPAQKTFDAAFTLLEQGRSVALQDFISESVIRPKYIPEAEIRQEQKLRQELSSVQSRLLDSVNHADLPSLQRLEHSLRHRHYQIILNWEKSYPAYFRARQAGAAVTPGQVRSALAEDAAYLSFGYTDGRLLLFAITRQSSILKVIPVDSARLASTLGSLRKALTTHPGAGIYKGTPYALQVYDWFIRPLQQSIGSKQEWIVNPGILEGIPVEVLESGKSINDFAANHFTIRYVYSAAFLLQQTPLTKTPPGILGIAPFTETRATILQQKFGYKPLAATREETGSSTLFLAGAQATRSSFLRVCGNYPIWHFSTHAFLDNVEYARSYIALYPDDSTYRHRLYADEISQMDLRNVRMVILSACETGSGPYYATEGTMSLARAFTYAGCPLTINSLWTAQDRSSAFLIQRYLAYLRLGHTPADSLRLARADFFRSEEGKRYNHPFFWANFVAIGVNEPLFEPPFFPGDFRNLSWALLGVALLLAGFFAYHHFFR